MFIVIGTKIAIASKSRIPDESIFYWTDKDGAYLIDNEENFLVHETESETEVIE